MAGCNAASTARTWLSVTVELLGGRGEENWRGAIASGDAAGFLAALSGRDIDHALQQLGTGLGGEFVTQPDAGQLVVLIVNRLTRRAVEGGQVLADDLLARLCGKPLAGRALPVNLELLSAAIEGDPEWAGGAYLDLTTGEVYPHRRGRRRDGRPGCDRP